MRSRVQLALVAAIALAAVIIAALAGVVPVEPGPRPAGPTADTGPGRLSQGDGDAVERRCRIGFSAVGASFTQGGGDLWNARGTRLHSSTVDRSSWAHWTDQDPRLVLEGGWALSGQTTGDVASKARAEWFEPDTELVIMLGTNDALLGTPLDSIDANLQQIVQTAGIPPEDVTVVLLPPNDHAPGQLKRVNDQLQRAATNHGWATVDVGSAMGDGRGWFRDGVSPDGTHLREPWARYAGESIAAALRADNPC